MRRIRIGDACGEAGHEGCGCCSWKPEPLSRREAWGLGLWAAGVLALCGGMLIWAEKLEDASTTLQTTSTEITSASPTVLGTQTSRKEN